MIKAGIAGVSGYTGGELIRLLINHPDVDIECVYSSTYRDQKISTIHKDLVGDTDLVFSDKININKIDILFLCLPHGKSRNFLEALNLNNDLKIIDLSNDYRLDGKNLFKGNRFVYGLPEANRELIKIAKYLANPGCFATAIQLSLLPLAANNLIKSPVHVNATTGSTGAGSELVETTGFNWRDSNFSSYKQFTHQHLNEIQETLTKLQDSKPEINFIPNRGNFTRGIFCSAYMELNDNTFDYEQLFKDYYSEEPFTYVVDYDPNIKNVINTNKCFINVKVVDGKLLITSVIDNLLKGASGQAVQNMNIMFGIEEKAGLKLKASVY